ncbi:hypothetical protein H4Q26_016173 [Puccinia striiformis f. sp. tritici PST-130]|nr:hypothetical protein H4Q26_016173 [Puccinia striiformis f. sp. tritici PST-130]
MDRFSFSQSPEYTPTLRTVQSREESDGRKNHSTPDELARQSVRDLAGLLSVTHHLAIQGLHRLQVKFSEASEELYSSCFEASSLIEHMKLSPEEFNRRTDEGYLGFYTQDAIDSAKSAVGYITQSDLDFAQSCWKGHLEQINSVLWEIEAMVKPGTYMGYEDVTGDITELRYLLCIAEAADPAANGQKFVRVAEDFKSRFDALLLGGFSHFCRNSASALIVSNASGATDTPLNGVPTRDETLRDEYGQIGQETSATMAWQ